jgi:glycosyltransferase involved in cell wall biosynthesis
VTDQRANPAWTALQAGRRAAARSLTNTANGFARSLPPPLRARVRSVVAQSDRRSAPPIEDWSRPLIAARSGPEGPRPGVADLGGTVTGPAIVEPRPSREVPGSHPADLPVLRCLIVTTQLDVGGMQEMAAFLGRRLPAYQLRTAVLDVTGDPSASGQPGGRLGRMLQASGVEVHETGERDAPGWIERWRPDVISAHGALPACVLDAAQRVGAPFVDTLHGMHDLFGADWKAESARGAKISAIVSVSEVVRQQYLAGNRGFPRDRIVTVPNGVDDERRAAGDRTAARARLGLTDEYLFVSLARHCLQKNSYGLLAAFGQLARHRPEAHLVIAGRVDDIRYYRQVLRLRDSLPGRNRIHLRDHAAAPAELLAAADGFVLDAFFEGWSLASTEALSAGLPAVLSDVGGAREQIAGDPARGYLVGNPLGDPLTVNWESIGAARYREQVNRDEFAIAMDHLVADRENYLRNRQCLAAESAARFSADACLARHAAVLRAAALGTDLPDTGLPDTGLPDTGFPDTGLPGADVPGTGEHSATLAGEGGPAARSARSSW